MTILYENLVTGDDTFFSIRGVDGRILAQTFIPLISHNLTEVKVRVSRIATPGTINMSIKSVDGSGHPTGSDLSTGSFDGDIVGEGSGNQEWVTVAMTSLALSANTEYALLMQAPNGQGVDKAILWWIESPGSYTRGNTEWSTDSGSTWDAQSDAYDAMFEDRGLSLLPSDPTTRVTSLIHRYDRGTYTLEIHLGEIVADFGLPEWDSKPKPAVEKSPEEKLEEEIEHFREIREELTIPEEAKTPELEETLRAADPRIWGERDRMVREQEVRRQEALGSLQEEIQRMLAIRRPL